MNMLNLRNRLGKSMQLSRILVVFMAGVLLLVSTACSSPNSSKISTAKFSDRTSQARQEDRPYDYYDANQPKKDGMNQYNDDPRADAPSVQTKTRQLIDNAKANIKQNNSEGYLENTSAKLKQAAEDTSEAVQDKLQSVGQATKNAVENTVDSVSN